jgi:hypothetical protein
MPQQDGQNVLLKIKEGKLPTLKTLKKGIKNLGINVNSNEIKKETEKAIEKTVEKAKEKAKDLKK